MMGEAFDSDQPGAGEVGQDAGLGGDPASRRLLPQPGEVHQLQTQTPLRVDSVTVHFL